MDLQAKTPQDYFSKDMRQEFHVAIAKRDARKILKRVDYHKTASLLEKHVDLKYSNNRKIVGS